MTLTQRGTGRLTYGWLVQVFPSTGAYMPGDTNKHDLKIPSLARPKFTPKQEQWIQEHVQATRSHSLQPKAVYRPVQHHLYKVI